MVGGTRQVVMGARMSVVCKRHLLFHLTPLWEGSRRVRSCDVRQVGVGGCVMISKMLRQIMAYVARARTGWIREREMRRMVWKVRKVRPVRMTESWRDMK